MAGLLGAVPEVGPVEALEVDQEEEAEEGG